MIGNLLSGIGSVVGGVATAAGQMAGGVGQAAGTVLNAGGQVLSTTARTGGAVLQTAVKEAPSIIDAAGNVYGIYAGYQQRQDEIDLARKMYSMNAGGPQYAPIVLPNPAQPAVNAPTKTQTDAPGFDRAFIWAAVALVAIVVLKGK